MDGEDYATKLNEDLEKIKAYRKSLEEEFASTEANDPTIPAKAKKKVFELIPDAGVQISYLMKHAESESIRANLSKWVFDVCLKEAARKGDDDTMEKLIADLTGGQPA